MFRTIKRIHSAVYRPIDDLITYSPLPTPTLDQIDPFIFLNLILSCVAAIQASRSSDLPGPQSWIAFWPPSPQRYGDSDFHFARRYCAQR